MKSNVDNLCVMSLEILAIPSQGRPLPEPDEDPLVGVFYAVYDDVCNRHHHSDHSGGFVCYPPLSDDEDEEDDDQFEGECAEPEEDAADEAMFAEIAADDDEDDPQQPYSRGIKFLESEAEVFTELAAVILKYDSAPTLCWLNLEL